MKTMEQILREKSGLIHKGELSKGAKIITVGEALAAMREAASQAIDRCASKSFRKNIEVAGVNEIWEIVRKEEILKVKADLK